MEEKIIIDEVNVAGCEFYQIEANELYPKAQYCGSMRNTFCEDEPNCYYKQLKRLEQENEKIKKQYNCYACGNCKGTEDYINLEKHHKGLRKQFDKYHKALEEIKKISRVNPVDSCWTLLNTCGNCPEKSECNHSLQSPFTVIREIKNIITETIGK